MEKFALISFGNEESYGLLYAGTEFKKHGEIKFFDAEMTDVVPDIIKYCPDYICFSPMTTFFKKAKDIELRVKEVIPTVSIYGGHHAMNCGESIGDITVVGGVIDIDLTKRGIVTTGHPRVRDLIEPAREEYYRDIPRMKTRYRKVMLSVTGCPFTCTYCSSSNYKCLEHRDINAIIKEALYIKDSTHEIEWVDDDIFYGDQGWLLEFIREWKKQIGIPMYVSTTSINANKTKENILSELRGVVNCIGMGVQAIRPSSLELLGRKWDNYDQINRAYNHLTSNGFKVNMQCIVGLPIDDPIEDALETIQAITKIGKGSIISCYPLQVYPNTKMMKYCVEKGYKFNEKCLGDTNSGLPAIDFGDKTNNRLVNICKLATMVVKCGIDRRWLKAMLDMDLSEASQPMSMVRYYECIKDRLPEKAYKIYDDIISTMNVRY